jgi:hypothetical protein
VCGIQGGRHGPVRRSGSWPARLGPARSWPASLNGRSGPCKQARENLGPVRSLTEPTERTEGGSRRHGWGVAGAWRGRVGGLPGAWRGRGRCVASSWRLRRGGGARNRRRLRPPPRGRRPRGHWTRWPRKLCPLDAPHSGPSSLRTKSTWEVLHRRIGRRPFYLRSPAVVPDSSPMSSLRCSSSSCSSLWFF